VLCVPHSNVLPSFPAVGHAPSNWNSKTPDRWADEMNVPISRIGRLNWCLSPAATAPCEQRQWAQWAKKSAPDAEARWHRCSRPRTLIHDKPSRAPLHRQRPRIPHSPKLAWVLQPLTAGLCNHPRTSTRLFAIATSVPSCSIAAEPALKTGAERQRPRWRHHHGDGAVAVVPPRCWSRGRRRRRWRGSVVVTAL
jgi:hypothetical protein